jgi:hypothetical protein
MTDQVHLNSAGLVSCGPRGGDSAVDAVPAPKRENLIQYMPLCVLTCRVLSLAGEAGTGMHMEQVSC